MLQPNKEIVASIGAHKESVRLIVHDFQLSFRTRFGNGIGPFAPAVVSVHHMYYFVAAV